MNGELTESIGSGQAAEVQARGIEVLGTCDNTYPLQKKGHTTVSYTHLVLGHKGMVGVVGTSGKSGFLTVHTHEDDAAFRLYF